MIDISNQYPQFQFSIRQAQEILKTPLMERNDADIERLNARGQQRIDGRNLYFVLTSIMGIPMATPTLVRNYYTVDGYWFALKNESGADDERQPLYVSTANVTKSQQAVSFTLFVGKVIADPDYSGWPTKKVLVGRNMHLYNANYTQLRADLGDLIDELDAAYLAAIPPYQAWKALQTDPAEQQDFFMQLIRKALRELPAREVISEPVEVMQAALQDSLAQMDGLRLGGVDKSTEVTLATLDDKAQSIFALLDDLLPENYEAFDDDDQPDDFDEDDLTDEDFDDEVGLFSGDGEGAEDAPPDDDDDEPPHDGEHFDDEDDGEDFDDEDEGETPSPDLNRHDEASELIPA